MQEYVEAQLGLMILARAENDSESGGRAHFSLRPAGSRGFVTQRPARDCEAGCERHGNADRDLLLRLEVEPQEQVDHAIRSLVSKEPSGK